MITFKIELEGEEPEIFSYVASGNKEKDKWAIVSEGYESLGDNVFEVDITDNEEGI